MTLNKIHQVSLGVGGSLFRGLFPPLCIRCQTITADRSGLCPTCWSKIHWIDEPMCQRNGTPFLVDPPSQERTVSLEALHEAPPWHRLRAACCFDEASRLLIHAFKFRDQTGMALPLAKMMIRAGHALLSDADVIIPIPIHRTRLLSRRYNQSALLARSISQITGIPCLFDALTRRVKTVPQTGLTRGQRASNVSGVFAVEPRYMFSVSDKTVLLIDDVATSRATLKAATRALQRKKARRVDVLVFALVIKDETDL